jgi:hypothetical protein
MYSPTYELACFSTVTHEEKLDILKAMLEALILANVFYLRHRPDTPPLYAAGVPYVVEPPGRDNWQDIPRTLALREGDCEDLACYRIAELRVRHNENAMPYVTAKKIGTFTLFHIQVERGDGTVEDPSRILGMR